jgi:integrase
MSKRGHGEGSIEKLDSGKFRAVIRINGKKVTSPAFSQKADAQKWLAEAVSNRDRYVGVNAGKRVTVEEWLRRWLKIKEDQVKATTMEWYSQRIDKHIIPRVGHLAVGRLDKAKVEDWMMAMKQEGVSANQRKNTLRVLRYALNSAAEDGLINRNPCSAVKPPKRTKKEDMICLTEEEAKKVVEASSPNRLAAYFILAIDSGARPNELLALHWTEVDLSAGLIRIIRSIEGDNPPKLGTPKTDKGRRKILISPSTIASLKEHREKMKAEGQDMAGLVFPALNGNIQRLTHLWRAYWKPVRLASEIDPRTRLYDLRHTSATLLIGRGVNLRVVSDRLGHESIEVTLRFYAHAMPDQQERARQEMDSILRVAPGATQESNQNGKET